jgi:hypothetical protein
MNRHLARNSLLLSLLWLAAPPSHAHGGAEGGGILIVFFCMIFGLLAALASQVIIRFKPRAYVQRLLAAFAAGSIVFSLSTGIWMHIWTQNYKEDLERHQKIQTTTADTDRTWLENSLAQAACDANIPALQRELADSNHSRRVKLLSLQYCAIEKSYPEVARLLLDNLQQPTLQQEKFAHCQYLAPAFRHLDVEILAIFAERKLSLDCRYERNKIPTWWSEPYQANAFAHPRLAEYLRFLKNQGVDLHTKLGERNLLSYVIQTANAEAILYVIKDRPNVQFDLPNESYWTIKQSWTLRQFDYPTRSPQGEVIETAQLTKKEKEKIDKIIGPLNQNEIQFIKADQQRFSDWNEFPDSGARFFHFLITQGAQLHIPNQFGSGLINERTQITADFSAELDQLSEQQMRFLVCPVDLNGVIQRPLYQWAKNHNNRSMMNYLERRQLTSLC